MSNRNITFLAPEDLDPETFDVQPGGLVRLKNNADVGRFEYIQIEPSSLWNISHNLNTYPAVITIDTAGDLFHGDVSYLDENNIQVSINPPTAGRASLR